MGPVMLMTPPHSICGIFGLLRVIDIADRFDRRSALKHLHQMIWYQECMEKAAWRTSVDSVL
jgi:hypothetical protein